MRHRLEEHISSLGHGAHQQIGDLEDPSPHEGPSRRERRHRHPSRLAPPTGHVAAVRAELAAEAEEEAAAGRVKQHQMDDLERK